MSGGMSKLCKNVMTDVCAEKKWTMLLVIFTHSRNIKALGIFRHI